MPLTMSKARQERDKLINEAEAFFNDVVPRARGESAQLVAQAEAYSKRLLIELKVMLQDLMIFTKAIYHQKMLPLKEFI